MKRVQVIIVILLLISGCAGCFFLNGLRSFPRGNDINGDFEAFKEKRLTLPESREPVCLVAVGDIMLSRGISRKIETSGDLSLPFARTRDFLQSGDITCGNLEAPITPGRDIMMSDMVLRTDPGTEYVLGNAGFDVLFLANNHMLDWGAQGVLDTMQYLRGGGIEFTGAGKTGDEAYGARYLEVKGTLFAFLAFCHPSLVPLSRREGEDAGVIAFCEPEKMRAAIEEAAQKADFTVVSLHAGTEYSSAPDNDQVRFARLAIDAGADIVLGHHPHVLQKVERYKGKYIFYSLGNFVFDQMWSRATRESLVARIYISRNEVEKFEFIPVFINDSGQPEVLTGRDAEQVLAKLGVKCQEMPVPRWDNDRQVFVEGKIYVHAPRPFSEYRLVQNRYYDLDRDGEAERYALKDGRLVVRNASREIWHLPGEWWVEYFFPGDANNDGISELSMFVWKTGNFGPSRPFWVQEIDNSIKSHLFIFKLEEGSFKPVWQSSNLDRPGYRGVLEDLDGDGDNELMVTEGVYSVPGKRQITLWEWNGWGFSRINVE